MINFKCVDAVLNIWRSGQPLTSEDVALLKEKNIKHIIKLNPSRLTIEEERILIDGNIDITYCPINTIEQLLTEPDKNNVQTAITFIVPDTMIHCEHGEDRTGVVVALWRFLVQKWRREVARKEMLDNNFHTILFGLDRLWYELTS